MNEFETESAAGLASSKTVTLRQPVVFDAQKTTFEEINLNEPVLLQVQQYYDEQQKNGALSAMGLLISLVSNVPLAAIKKLRFRDYKECEAYLVSFLTYSPPGESGSGSSPS